MIKDILLLNRLGWFQLKNKLAIGIREKPLATVLLTALGILFFWGYLNLSFKLLRFVFGYDDVGVTVASILVQFLLFIALGVSLMSSLTTAIAHLYLSQDLEFHFSLPVRFSSWMLHRFGQVFLQSNWMLLIFGGPLIWMYLHLSKTGWAVPLLGVAVFALVCTFPVLLATFLCLLLVKIFPAKRVHQVFLVLTVVLVSSFVLVFRYLEPERFIGPGGMDRFLGIVEMVDLEKQRWNPAFWPSHVIIGLSQMRWEVVIPQGTKLLVLFGLCLGALLLAGKRFYRSSWDRALQSLSGERELAEQPLRRSRLSRWLEHPFWSQEARELLLFFRDPSQWSQVFVMAALLGLYLFSLTRIPSGLFGGAKYGMAVGNAAFVGFISLSVASRFVFTSFSADGHALWLLKTAPEGWVHFMRGKLLVFGLPTLVFSLLLSVLSGVILGLSVQQLWLLGIHSFWDGAVMVLLALALGMLFINPNIENPLKLIVSPGGLLLMAGGLFVVGLHAVLRLSEESKFLNHMLLRIGWPDVQQGRAAYYYAGLIAVETGILGIMIRKGIAHLRRGEL